MLAARIAAEGPISIAEYMARANAHYYATRDPIGTAGDFTTAPEISQMFGELIGAWLADLWRRAGSPAEAAYVEFGPGRGTLAVDALRVMAHTGLAPAVHFVETSPALRAAQARRVPGATWHETVETLPHSAPLLIVANEFFDALPVRQLVATDRGWRERAVGHGDGGFFPTVGGLDVADAVPERLRTADPGSVVELRPAADDIVTRLCERIEGQGGAALIVDYGHEGPATGDTLQAVSRHAFADPFAAPGEHDLTAHIDFASLEKAAQATTAYGPVGQGQWLIRLGIAERAATLAARSPDRAGEIAAALHRLTDATQMGTLFKAMALTARGWPQPVGFDGD